MLKIDGYKILGQIYESTNTRVCRGWRERDGQPVILKFLKDDYPTPSELKRYKQEYEIARKLNLDGAIKAYELQSYKQTLIIIFEDFGAISLQDLMSQRREANRGLLSLQGFIRIAIQITQALGSIHAENIIHKDINPANIVVNLETGEIKIIDFGISTIFSRENPTLKNPNVLEGTLAYISPEQTGRMNRSLDYRTDFYSLGITFYELLTGQLPFSTNDALELVHCQIAKQAVSLSEINPEIPQILSDIVIKLMAKTAEERYQSAFGIQSDLVECLNQLETLGTISNFPLGTKDISDRFQIPQKLYGREEEVEALLTTFERVVDNPDSQIEMMLVAGYSGIGKSSLVAEIHKPNTRLRGYFTEGKFDQFQRSVPYSAITSAFKGLVRQLLSETEEQLQKWREQLLAAVGSSGQVIVDIIPEVELIIGKQSPVPELGASESQSRFNLVFGNFIRVFCTQEHPLVIFLDDLQWVDPATLKLIELIMTDTEMKYLFLIGAYRDNEVSPSHPLIMTLDGLRKKEAIINSITLEPLEQDNICQLLADTLNSDLELVNPLAELVMRKTGGNPFFTNQFLTTLYSEKLITFYYPASKTSQESTQSGFWQWAIDRIEAQNITDNVVELMVGKLKKLPDFTQQILRLAACIGSSFALSALAIVSEQPREVIFSDLVTAVQAGFVLPISELDENLLIQDYKFLHDRVQQAAYSLIDDTRKKAIHLQIGRLLLANTSATELPEKIFEIADHLNLAGELITDESERVELARLNLEAGTKAKESTAYAAAVEQYFTYGIEMLPGDSWQEHYDLTFRLYRERSECEYLCGNFDKAEDLFDYILTQAKSNLERIEIQNIRITLYDLTGKYKEAIAVGEKALQACGISLPATETAEILSAFDAELQLYRENLRGLNISELINAPEMTDRNIKACMKILMNITGPAYFTDQDLLALACLKMVNLSIEYGNSDVSAHGYSFWGVVSGCRLVEYEVGYEFGLLSIALNEKFNNVNLACKIFNLFGALISPWRSHLKKDGIPYLRKGYLAGVETGDIYVCYNTGNLAPQNIISANNFDSIIEESNRHLEFLRKIKSDIFVVVQQFYQHFIFNLKGLTSDKFSLSDENFDESQCLQLWQETAFLPGTATYYIFKAQIFFHYEDYERALETIRNSTEIIVFISGMANQGEYYLYYSLILTALYPTANDEQQQEYDEILKANQQQMKIWADNCPENFLHKYLLVEAEIARISGKGMEALDLYDRAIASAREQEYIQNEALGNELAAKFWLGKGKEDIAQIYMIKAHHGYQVWGAKRKVEDLEEKYPELLTLRSIPSKVKGTKTTYTSTNRDSGKTLDLATFMKASQAISREIVLGQLLTQLINILLENTGAQSGFLILETEGELLIEAEAWADGQITVLQSMPLDFVKPDGTLPLLSSAVINYVARTHESVVLNDARNEGNFTAQSYIQKFQVKSVLCVPLVNQGQLRGLAYLENNLTSGAFTQERVEIVQLLSGEAAIAISNAQLYRQLQESEQQVKQLYDASKRFVPEQFLSFLAKESIADVKLGDQVEREMTVLFSDIRDFTLLSEQMTPTENFAFINEYLGYMEPQIQKHGGFIDKYIGDAIMALFPNAANDAVRGAIAMLEALKKYNQMRQDKHLQTLSIGIGLHTGSLMLGTVGGMGRMDGTAIGDAVNLSSRVEGLNKVYGTSLLMTDRTWERLNDPLEYDLRFIDRVKAKGKTKAVSLFELFSADPKGLRAAKRATKTKFEQAVLLYHDASFQEAAHLFEECANYHTCDRAAYRYLERCQTHIV